MLELPRYETPRRLEDVLERLAEFGARARVVAGATDLLRLARLDWEAEDGGGGDAAAASPELLIDVTRIPGLDRIDHAGEALHIRPLVTHTQIIRSPLVVRRALPLAQACLDVGTPQVRNRGTLAGSIASAHASSDPIPALIALGATARLRSQLGVREVAVRDLCAQDPIRPDEMIVGIGVPVLGEKQRGLFSKLRPRPTAGVATVNLAIILEFADDATVAEARVVVGGAVPAEISAVPLPGQTLHDEAIEESARFVANEASSVEAARAGVDYRRTMLEVMVRRALRCLRDGSERARWPNRPIALRTPPPTLAPNSPIEVASMHRAETPIVANVNGRVREAPRGGHRTLLEWLREGLGLTGAKDGCGEGVCGACTVLLDGVAVAACLVPSPRAHGATITTVEGLSVEGPSEGRSASALQRAFIEENALQCGFCTPGFLVASSALLADSPDPSLDEIEAALAGNLCRCTGYRAIARAVRRAASEAP